MAANGDVSSVPRSESPTGSPRSASISLHAAAAMNAGLQREPSRMPAPGEMFQDHMRASPQPVSGAVPPPDSSRHHRTPSLGELHQELEAEQEGHVNRLLNMIRQQQLELQRLQANHPHAASGDESAAGSERPHRSIPVPISTQSPTGNHVPSVSGSSFSRSPIFPHHRNSMEMARADIQRRSRTPSRNASPRLRATSISAESGDWSLFRDESAFYQAETQMLTRENQMLRHRIRELARYDTRYAYADIAFAQNNRKTSLRTVVQFPRPKRAVGAFKSHSVIDFGRRERVYVQGGVDMSNERPLPGRNPDYKSPSTSGSENALGIGTTRGDEGEGGINLGSDQGRENVTTMWLKYTR
ncbi:fad dependent oxidoreductase [Trichoderma arundinaceum]|uniref:Fad dependent oxidoreductase n=1 Tax=Trichoderma arundinaceum TaxID=490622 RepID=A0A395N8P5_TRIAR|nr:fad dependent oxidoreductase [Trichoderma arundinaceum]